MSALRTLVLCICVVFIVSFLVVATDRDIRDLVASPILKPAAKVIPPLAQKPKTKTQVVKFPKVVNLETYGDFGIQKPVKILPSKNSCISIAEGFLINFSISFSADLSGYTT